jgi:hydroxymethylglutaryl-CoA lyase
VYPSRVKIVEVGARDGLQIEKRQVASRDKIQLIDMLSDAGLPVVEVTSFVNPKLIPQMADAQSVLMGMRRREGIRYPVLVMDEKGLQKAISCDVREIAVFSSASDPFAIRNVNRTAENALLRTQEIVEQALAHNMTVRGYVSCVLGCPYAGAIDPQHVTNIAKRLIDMGCYEISLGDTIGIGTPGSMRRLLESVLTDVPADKVAVHCHDTYGQSLANILTALEMNVTTVDASISGLGGCPFAEGATGNAATEDVVYMLHGMGIETGVDMDKLLQAGAFIDRVLGRKSCSRAANAIRARKQFERSSSIHRQQPQTTNAAAGQRSA